MEGDDKSSRPPANTSALANAACLKMLTSAKLARLADAASIKKDPQEADSPIASVAQSATPNDLSTPRDGANSEKEHDTDATMQAAASSPEATPRNENPQPSIAAVQDQSGADTPMQDVLMEDAELFLPENAPATSSKLKRSPSEEELVFKQSFRAIMPRGVSDVKAKNEPGEDNVIVLDSDSEKEVVKKEPREDNIIVLDSDSDDEVIVKKERSFRNVIKLESDDESIMVISDDEAASANPNHGDDAMSISSASSQIDSDGEENDARQGSRKEKKARRKTGPRARTAREAHFKECQRRRSRQEARALKRREQGIGRPAKKTAQNSKAVSPRKSGKKRSQENQSKHADLGLSNLFNNDVFNIDESQANRGPAPDFTATKNKKDLMQNLEAQMTDADKDNLHRTKVDMNKLQRMSRLFGYNNMVPYGQNKWKLEGMDTALYHHQLIGCHFMLTREFNYKEDGPYGGILADGMGLGKTVQVIATIIANPPLEENKRKPLEPIFVDGCEKPLDIIDGRGATLVVVPSSLLHQWRSEILKHGKPTLVRKDTLVYKASRIEELDGFADPATAKVVITSYHEVMSSCPWPDKEMLELMKKKSRSKKDKQGDDESSALVKWIANNREEGSYLHKVHWNRIVLDEAHLIKNQSSKTSLACNALMGSLRWALSGTPIMNFLEEFFPYFRFVKHTAPEIISSDRFSRELCEDQICSKKLAEMLKTTMIRRVMQDRILGNPIVPLPRPWSHIKLNRYPATETAVYRAVERKFIGILNKHFAKGHELKNYSYLIVQMTRLRQLTAHPCLMEASMKIIFEESELLALQATLYEIYTRSQTAGLVLHDQINYWIEDKKQYKKNLAKAEEYKALKCDWCLDDPRESEPTYISQCKHVFCQSCIDTHGEHQLASGKQEVNCPAKNCNIVFDPLVNLKPFKDPAKSKKKGVYSAKKSNKKGKDFLKYLSNTDDTHSNWVERADDRKSAWYESTKLLAVQQEIQKCLQIAPKEKIIVFSQWRMFIRLIGRYLDEQNFGFVYFTGDMTTNEREKAVEAFENKQKVRIMIVGLKCGGVGLNLTAASRVISTDLWWNSCVEKQAFGRVYRIGQSRETHFTRIVALNTIDDRLLKLQEKKDRIVDHALQDRSLTEEEIAGLFGRVTRDSNGNLHIIPEYDGKDEFDKLNLNKDKTRAEDEEEPQERSQTKSKKSAIVVESDDEMSEDEISDETIEDDMTEDEMIEDDMVEDEIIEDEMSE